MKKLVCTLLALAMALSLVACGKPAETTPSGETGKAVHRDTLTVGISREPKALIPYASNDTGSSYITSLIYDKLIDTDKDMNLIPGLAESWDKIDDTHYRFHLRKGVKFHNGTELTAKDVLYTFEKNSAADATSSTIGPVDIKNSVIEDDYTVVIALSKVYPPFLNICSLDIAAIVCKDAMEADPAGYAKNPIGSGPFKFVEWASGDYIKLDSNTEWWGGDINFDHLMLRYIPEASTRAIEAESGGVDIAQIVVSDAQTVDASDDVDLLVQEILNTSYLSFNCSKEPFNNVKVRQAISMAIDAEAIVEATYYGYAKRADSFLAPAIWGYHGVSNEYSKYDPEKAKALLTEAGYPDGFSCTMISNASQATAEMIQAYLAEVGIKVTLNVTDFSNWLDSIVNGKQEMYIGGWTVPSADASEAFTAFNSANIGKGDNRSFYGNDKVDGLIEKINSEADPDTRMQYCKELQEFLAEECVTIGLNVGVTFYAVSKDISGFYVLPTQSPKFHEITFAK